MDLNGSDEGSFNAFHQYQLSKACLCFFTRGLNARLLKAGIDHVWALTAEPGFAATGVNVQHDLGHSLFCAPNGLVDTRFLHAAGCHAADGALPMVLAAIDATASRGDWYTPKTRFAGEPIRGDPSGHSDASRDPLNARSSWPQKGSELFWEQAQSWTGAKWDLAGS